MISRIFGGLLAVLTELIFVIGGLFAIGSMRRYLRIRAM